MKLNSSGKSHAIALINSGKVDKTSSWSINSDDENAILGDNKWSEYGRWFLGINLDAKNDTKDHYHYPFGKSGKVYRSALIAIRQRAGQQKATDIYDAAGSLLEKIDGNKEQNSIGGKVEIERRSYKVDLRTDSKGGMPVIRGTAAMFNSMSENLGGFREMIAPGAFKAALTNSDVRALFNHDPNMILGRCASGTLRLVETDTGLEFECDPPDTSYARDLMASMQRGDINQCSFGFSIDDGGDSWEKDSDGQWVRTVRSVSRVFDVSPVTYPAYVNTDCSVRSLNAAIKTDEEKRAAEEAAKIPPYDPTAIMKLRMELENSI